MSVIGSGGLEVDVKKRLFAVAVTALLPGIGLLAYNELSNRYQRNAEVHLQASQAAQNAASELDKVLEGAKSLLIAVSALPTVSDLDATNCSVSLNRISESLQMTGAILVINAQRKLVCDSKGNPAGTDFSERSYVNDALNASGNGLVVGTYTISKLTGAAVLPVAVPLKRDEATIGVVATAIKLDWLQARLTERGQSAGGSVAIADRNGVILALAPSTDAPVGQKLPEPLSSYVSAPGPGTVDATGLDGTRQIIGYRPVSTSFPVFVSAGVSREEAFHDIDRTTWTSILMLALTVVAAFLAASYVGSRFILQPIYHIVSVLEAYKSGDRAIRTRMKGRAGELGLVGDTLDGLLDELEHRGAAAEEAEERRTLLVGELRHRVKNTLAVVTAIARQTFPRDERLESYSQRLTALARAYDLIFAGQEGRPDATISDIVHSALAPYERNGHSPFKVAGPSISVHPEAGLALSLICHELATNATKYGALSAENGQVRISWDCVAGRVSFLWQEEGGPPVTKPERSGFGSQLIRRAFSASYQPELTLDFLPKGLSCFIEFDARVQPVPMAP
jgi:two-component sensor histidine kinase